MCSDIEPAENAVVLRDHIGQAASDGADIIFTPEMTGMMDLDRNRASQSVRSEQEDIVLQTAVEMAEAQSIWVALGSLAIADNEDDERWVNRSFLIDPMGHITRRYDKIHLFDVTLGSGEPYRESAAYRPGERSVLAEWAEYKIGLSICYDLRFGALYSVLAGAGADIIAVPAAFTVPTGRAHWKALLRARAIESAAFVVAAAQCGEHRDGRKTYGHSMVIDPWGEILLDMETKNGVATCDIDLSKIGEVRAKIPATTNRRKFENPKANRTGTYP